MQKNIKKRGAILCAAVVIGFMVVYLGLVLFTIVSSSFGDLIGMLAICIFVAIIAAVIWGVFAALRQRLKEIDKGEEEEAKKY